MITMSKFISIFRLAALIIAASLLTGCSAIKLAYNQAPDLTYWWLDGYFDFNEQQTPKVRDELTKLFAWHRTQELPKTAAFLSDAARLMPGDISAAQVCLLYAQARGLLDNVSEQAMPALAELAPTITPEQINHLNRKFAKVNEEFARDYIRGSNKERIEKSIKRSIDRSESLYGKLGEAQITVIQRLVNETIFDAAFSLKERQRRQQDLIERLNTLANSKASAATAQQSVRDYFTRVWTSPDTAYRAYAEKLTQQNCQSFASVHNSTTAAQRAKAVQVLKGYEQDLRSLTAAKP
ncbi:MAG: DUF6279 family lipoprotein [Brachymonas sp.]